MAVFGVEKWFSMDSEKSPDIKTKNKKLRRQRMLEFTIAGSLLIAFGLLFVNWVSDKYLDKEIGILEKELAEFRASDTLEAKRSRPLKGNAAWDYQLIEWVLSPRADWQNKNPKHLPKSELQQDDSFSQQQLILLNKFSVDFKPPIADEAALIDDKYASLYPLVHTALKKQSCEWGYPIERLFDSKLDWMAVESQSMKQFASFMALHSLTKSPDERLQIAVDIIAFGQDYSRHQNPTAVFKSAFVKDLGYRLLEKTLGLPISNKALKAALKRLNSIGLIDGLRVFKCLPLGHKSFLTRLRYQQSGASPNSVTKSWIDSKPYGLRSRSTIFLAWEWSYSKALFAQIHDYQALPFSQRKAKKEALMKSLDGSKSVFGKIVVPLCVLFLDFDYKPNCKHEMLKILIAAKLHNMEKGTWPQSLDALSPYAPKGFAKDGYTDSSQPYKLLQKGERFFVYSVYEDTVDQNAQVDERIGKELWQTGDLALSLATKAASKKPKQKPKK
ncbi:MAG: hypothetical protein P1V97_03945 [Planctomycetota bacterium]|nr:hypothetical protein [Planctomycetota bacterium]